MSRDLAVRGALANVDYDSPLTRYRAREVLLEARRRFLAFVENCEPYILVDSYYVHYTEPILRRPRDISDEKLLLWYKVLSVYMRSQAYSNAVTMSRGNPRISRILAVKLVKVYFDALSKIERDRDARYALLTEFKTRSEGKEPSKYIKSIIHRLEYDIRTSINMNIGNIKRVNDAVKRVRSTLGNIAGDEIAEILMDPEDESSRLRLVEILNSLLELARRASEEIELLERNIELRGYISGLKKLSRIRELRDLAPSERARASVAREVLAYRLATGNLLVREHRLVRKPKLYLLVDKSGSMFYAMDVKIEDIEGLSKITWATALALALLLKGGKVIVRFFDKRAHEPIQDKLSLIKVLLRLTPLGGTSITNALYTAVEDAYRNPAIRDYKLMLITDGEDSNIDINVLMAAGKLFKEFTVILIGGDNVILERYCN
ncbi:MAG: VWA containing CoxE family protein, partial [Crenarchaeota archaeon]|nr:VWA containing CoxE family protein [Thermoproteota archaeon]